MVKKIYEYPVAWILPVLLFFYINGDFVGDLLNSPYSIFLEFCWAVLVFQVISWADAYEPEPKLAMLWTVLASSSISIWLVARAYEFQGGRDFGFIYVGIVEETVKALILIPIFRSKLIHSWIDGYVYGALAGLGFSISEDFLYAAYETNSVEIILVRGMESIFAHSVFTGLIGAALAFAYFNNRISGILLTATGVLAHIFWNTVVVNFNGGNFVVIALTPLVFAGFALKLRNIEHIQILRIADSLRNSTLIDSHEYSLITNLSYRKAFRAKYKTAVGRKEFDDSINRIITNYI